MTTETKPKSEYPGQGAAWADFLHFRHVLILEWTKEGRPFIEIAATLSMDPGQVYLISQTTLAQVAGK